METDLKVRHFSNDDFPIGEKGARTACRSQHAQLTLFFPVSHLFVSVLKCHRYDSPRDDRGFAMPLPTLAAAQVEWVIQQVVAYIEHQRQTYRPGAMPLSLSQKTAMHPFFPQSALDSTRLVVLAGQRVANPPFYGELVKMGFAPAALPDFALMAAITFVDTVVSHEPFTNSILFHELVHVVQYQKLGLIEFAAKYVRGFLGGGSYEAIPLEVNAYELEARFAAEPTKPFAVADDVQAWIDAGRF